MISEYTARYRLDQNLRGFDWYDFIDDPDEPISASEMNCFKYPSDEDVKRVGLRGLYIGMYDKWDANEHTSLVMEKYGWKPASTPFERTYRTFSNLDDRYENGVHDYMKWIKFGYGRATDHASKDIRNGHMTREQGVEMVRKFDHVRSSDLYYWLDYVGRTEEWFDEIADSYRSPAVWWQNDSGDWTKRNIWD